jgi:hypothetical protein
MTDKFQGQVVLLDSPISNAFDILPSDDVDIQAATRALYIGTPGDIRVRLLGGADVTFVQASGMLPVRVTRVFATETTADDIVGMY